MKKFIFTSLILVLAEISMSAQKFTLAVIPDTQNYTRYEKQKRLFYWHNNIDIFKNQTKLIAERSVSNGGDIAFAVHVGDFVHHLSERPSGWKLAEEAMSILDGKVPFIAVPGNHDCDRYIKVKKSKMKYMEGWTCYNKYFGSESKFFKGKDWYKGSYNGGVSSWAMFKGGGQDFLVMGLEYEPKQDVLDWAQKVLDAHKNVPVIIVTHEYLDVYDVKDQKGQADFDWSWCQIEGGILPPQLYEKFIKKNSQILFVLCGHEYAKAKGESFRVDVNDAGYKVYSLLTDYQGRSDLYCCITHRECGDGWMRFMEFDLEKSEVQIKTYSTEFKKFETDADSDFLIKFDFDWKKRFGK